MKTKYTFLNEGFADGAKLSMRYGVLTTGITALAGSVLSGIAALIIRCKGSEELREQELVMLRYEIDALKREIKKLTNRVKEEHLEDNQYLVTKINIYKKDLTRLSVQYEIVKSMSLKDLRKMIAKRTFARGIVATAIGSVVAGLFSGIGGLAGTSIAYYR